MPLFLTKVQIISRAFTLLGDEPVNDLTTIGKKGIVAGDHYNMILPTILSADNWRFATKILQLSKLTEVPPIDMWNAQYQLPGDYLAMRRPYPLVDYEIYESKVFTNADELTIEYRFVPDTGQFPPYFVNYLVLSLAETLALAIAEKESYAGVMAKLRQSAHSLALFTDAQSRPNRPIVNNSIVNVRFGSSSGSRRGFL